MRCWVYVDGFNFYHGAAKRTECKWIDLRALSQQLRPDDTIERVKYFPALVERRTDDPDQRNRQRTYWRALDTLGIVERIEGKFARWAKWMPTESSVLGLEAQQASGDNVVGMKPEMVRVMRSEEKGSDVNLAAHLVHDAHQTDPTRTFELALVVSGDTDLAEAIRLVVQDVGKPVHVCRPHRVKKVRNPENRTRQLDRVATYIRDIPTWMIVNSEFPPTISDKNGSFSKPSSW